MQSIVDPLQRQLQITIQLVQRQLQITIQLVQRHWHRSPELNRRHSRNRLIPWQKRQVRRRQQANRRMPLPIKLNHRHRSFSWLFQTEQVQGNLFSSLHQVAKPKRLWFLLGR